MILQETKTSVMKLQEISDCVWKDYEMIVIDARGFSRGLVVLQNPWEVIFQDWIVSPSILSSRFQYIGLKEMVFLTAVHGPYLGRYKLDFLKKIQRHRALFCYPLCILEGDFNFIRALEEEKGGIRHLNP